MGCAYVDHTVWMDIQSTSSYLHFRVKRCVAFARIFPGLRGVFAFPPSVSCSSGTYESFYPCWWLGSDLASSPLFGGASVLAFRRKTGRAPKRRFGIRLLEGVVLDREGHTYVTTDVFPRGATKRLRL